MNDHFFMQEALQEAHAAALRQEVPIGGVLVFEDKIIARAGNCTRERNDPIAHAEILLLREGGSHLGAQRLTNCELYVTLEPCTMCAAAISFARIKRLVFGAADSKGGGVTSGVRFFDQPTCHHKKIEIVGGVEADICSKILKDFFQERR
jgi:tRNA(Arg) A34 adenosine deaminase TadA